MIENVKVLVSDFDGIVNITENQDGYLWKKNRKNDLGIDDSILDQFFITKWKPVVLGQVSMEEQLSTYLKDYNLHHRVDEIIEYFIEKNSNLDQRVLDFVQKTDIPVYLASDIDLGRLNHFWNNLKGKDLFKDKFASSELHVKKSNSEFFKQAELVIKEQPENILFMDDDVKNVEIAKSCGWQGYHYSDFEQAYLDVFQSLEK